MEVIAFLFLKVRASQFSREIKNLSTIVRISEDVLPSWWKDLLLLWRPSGAESGEHGLRLAIRRGYFNFYRLGQSIARVEINRDGMPTAETNFKYGGDTRVGPLDNDYVNCEVRRFFGDMPGKVESAVTAELKALKSGLNL